MSANGILPNKSSPLSFTWISLYFCMKFSLDGAWVTINTQLHHWIFNFETNEKLIFWTLEIIPPWKSRLENHRDPPLATYQAHLHFLSFSIFHLSSISDSLSSTTTNFSQSTNAFCYVSVPIHASLPHIHLSLEASFSSHISFSHKTLNFISQHQITSKFIIFTNLHCKFCYFPSLNHIF